MFVLKSQCRTVWWRFWTPIQADPVFTVGTGVGAQLDGDEALNGSDRARALVGTLCAHRIHATAAYRGNHGRDHGHHRDEGSSTEKHYRISRPHFVQRTSHDSSCDVDSSQPLASIPQSRPKLRHVYQETPRSVVIGRHGITEECWGAARVAGLRRAAVIASRQRTGNGADRLSWRVVRQPRRRAPGTAADRP